MKDLRLPNIIRELLTNKFSSVNDKEDITCKYYNYNNVLCLGPCPFMLYKRMKNCTLLGKVKAQYCMLRYKLLKRVGVLIKNFEKNV